MPQPDQTPLLLEVGYTVDRRTLELERGIPVDVVIKQHRREVFRSIAREIEEKGLFEEETRSNYPHCGSDTTWIKVCIGGLVRYELTPPMFLVNPKTETIEVVKEKVVYRRPPRKPFDWRHKAAVRVWMWFS
ncbi:hypothetical protein [Caulobacter phage BL198]|uniref:Uncharacterized protein n=1 Tax=Caulobacter phage BL198 TaxID=3020395 RepID=A0AAE9WYX6_9CAUD|nr:hypothetical protein [Caulobacter phage BL198]